MTRDRKKSYIHTSVLIASNVMPTDGICLNINAPSIPRNKTMGSHSDHTNRCLVCSPSCGVGFNHVKLFVCGFIIVGAWGLLGWFHVMRVWFNILLGCIFVNVFILCPLPYCVSPAYNLAILSSVR